MITLNMSSGGAEEADCLVGASVHCVASVQSCHIQWLDICALDDALHLLTVGQEEVANLSYVTKAYGCE